MSTSADTSCATTRSTDEVNAARDRVTARWTGCSLGYRCKISAIRYSTVVGYPFGPVVMSQTFKRPRSREPLLLLREATLLGFEDRAGVECYEAYNRRGPPMGRQPGGAIQWMKPADPYGVACQRRGARLLRPRVEAS